MSSIYRKGRDGYYYYQAYLYNPESRKKDKRIFHSLRTKDTLEAKKKQKELDKKYEKQKSITSNSSKLYFIFKFNPLIFIIFVIAVSIFVINDYKSGEIKQNTNLSLLQEADRKNLNDKLKIKEVGSLKLKEQVDTLKKILPENVKITPKPKNVISNVVMPKFNIERIDRLSGAFNQGKLYVTLNKNSSKEGQRLLCERLAKRYNEFSNIIICLYANNRAGRDLARGHEKILSVEEQKKSWLAMYTYNSVEGEYFDDNPSGYLGIK